MGRVKRVGGRARAAATRDPKGCVCGYLFWSMISNLHGLPELHDFEVDSALCGLSECSLVFRVGWSSLWDCGWAASNSSCSYGNTYTDACHDDSYHNDYNDDCNNSCSCCGTCCAEGGG